jgi:hypothetical protein
LPDLFVRCSLLKIISAAAIICAASLAQAQTNLWIYTDHLVNGFQDWGWAPRNLTNTSPVHSGANSISVNAAQYQALSFHFALDFDSAIDINTSPYASLSFWANGGSSGGQILTANVSLDTTDKNSYQFPALTANTWQKLTVPLSSIGAANKTNLARITISLAGGSTGTFYVDDIGLDPAPEPALTHISVDATQTIRHADARWFGVNTATWDGDLSSSQTIPLLRQMGILTLRWPGGSTSDGYHWANDIAANKNFIHVATNIGAQVFTTVNYGSGTSNEAAAWVSFANITNHAGFKYWEIGNENYGTWETDNNRPANDPYTYALRAINYAALMKAADPAGQIKIGVVIVPGESSDINNSNHFAVNPRTGDTNYGWTPVMLATMKSLGFTPDFAIYHFYPEYTATNWQPNIPDSDALILQTAVNWAHDAANLRQQLNDYLGGAATNVELVCTENNSDSGRMGQQSTSIINALYLADSASQLMKTEFNSYLWWDLRNGTDTQGAFDPTLYGWRTVGDYGFLSGASNTYPIFYAEKLLKSFVRPGDTILNAASDNLMLASYASRKVDGSLALLVVNKTPTNILNAQIALTGFKPANIATTLAYGVAQDNAARVGDNSPGAQDLATSTFAAASLFTNAFPPYTLTLFTFPPAPSQLSVVSSSASQVVLQLQGQTNVPYVVESSTDLVNWIAVATNTMATATVNLTNQVSAGTPATYWRAVWLP